jgi:hypothetical protein
MAQVNYYVTCSKGGKFVKQAHKKIAFARRNAADMLRSEFDHVLSAVERHGIIFKRYEIPKQSILAAASAVRLPSNSSAAVWLSNAGVKGAHAQLASQLEEFPFTRQAIRVNVPEGTLLACPYA